MSLFVWLGPQRPGDASTYLIDVHCHLPTTIRSLSSLAVTAMVFMVLYKLSRFRQHGDVFPMCFISI